MNITQLKKGNEIQEIIRATEANLKNLKLLEERLYSKQANDECDGLHTLTLAAIYQFGDTYDDAEVQLSRKRGNAELLNIVIKTLEKQLKEFEKEFELL